MPSLEMTNLLMKEADIILATGGPGMVKAAYSSGKPALGVGAGNTPAIIDDSADIIPAVNSIIHSKTFDNGMICASEQSVIVLNGVYDAVRAEFADRGCYFLNPAETEKVRKTILINGALNARIVGQKASRIAELAGVTVPAGTKILIGEVESVELSEEFAHEKLSPVLAMYRAKDIRDAFAKAEHPIADGGYGHTSSIYPNVTTQKAKLDEFCARMKTCRVLVNTPSSARRSRRPVQLPPDAFPDAWLRLLGRQQRFRERGRQAPAEHQDRSRKERENMLWFRTPEKVYIKKGLPAGSTGRAEGCHGQEARLHRDRLLPLSQRLHQAYHGQAGRNGHHPHHLLRCGARSDAGVRQEGAAQMRTFEPDCIIALGGGSAMDAGKIMWVMYEHPDVDFADMAMRFIDIRKRVYTFPKMGEKAYFIAVPTSAGTGSEVTPFAVITDEKTGIKYPLADYQLLPNMAIIDTDFHMSAPRGLTAASGIDAVSHALEAYASVMATDYTDGLAKQALKVIFEYLPRAYDNGQTDVEAREKMANAATMAGMAFANAFLGVCHSMAHKLGAFHHLPHGVANALMLEEVLRFNSAEAPVKMGTFPQYDHPKTLSRYAEVADSLGLAGTTDEEKLESSIAAVNALKARVGIKPTIRDYGIDEADFLARLDDMTEQAFDDQCTGANPRYPLMSEIKQMYLNAYYGGRHFEEPPMPTAADFEPAADPHDFKRTYRKAGK